MAFFRIKKIKGKEYAYIVKNEWKPTAKSVDTLRGIMPRGSRQKVKEYLGRAYRFELKNNADFVNYLKINVQSYIESNDKNRIINDLIKWELFKFGISKDEFFVNLTEKKIQKNRKSVVLLINDGFMCNMTLKNLLEFKTEGDEQTDGYRFARAFVEAGIKVPQEVFIGLFGKLYKQSS